MFLFLYLKRLKCLRRDRDTVFWTLLFPILLATLFYIAFGNLLKQDESFSAINTAVVNNDSYQQNKAFQQALKSASTGEDRLLNLSVLTAQEAKQKLSKGEIDGVITVSDSITLDVRGSGLKQSVLKAFLDQYIETEKITSAILAANPSAAKQGLFNSLIDRQTFTKEITLSGANPDTLLNYFYALIAMACLYGSYWGMRNSTDIQPNLSALGARRSIAPTHKLTSVVSDLLASLTIHFAQILILLCYLAFVLKIDFGSRFGYVVLTCFMGSVTGISYGTFVGYACKKSERIKSAILIGISMFLSFLAGLMFVDMKYIIAKHVPVLSYFNPAALITDAFYSLYVYESLNRYFLNICILGTISVLLAFVSYLFVRRQRYASI
ncbi:MAG: ABC transporter permease [Oscillospiraceae bacterium]|nr:ABC transporter permease [Oscillospiraceae bacterium]